MPESSTKQGRFSFSKDEIEKLKSSYTELAEVYLTDLEKNRAIPIRNFDETIKNLIKRQKKPVFAASPKNI